tara:strand:+ start:1675 stop:1941 length:267 start_codon:yes stop_codon:yes gene_type:complete
MTEESCVTLVLDFALALFAHFATNFRVALRMTLGATAVDHIGALLGNGKSEAARSPLATICRQRRRIIEKLLQGFLLRGVVALLGEFE